MGEIVIYKLSIAVVVEDVLNIIVTVEELRVQLVTVAAIVKELELVIVFTVQTGVLGGVDRGGKVISILALEV